MYDLESRRRIIRWLGSVVCLFLLVGLVAPFLSPFWHVEAQGSTTKLGSTSTLTYTDTTCPKGATCAYTTTSVATVNGSGVESGQGPIASIVNSGPNGNVVVTVAPGSCPSGKVCGIATSYNIYSAGNSAVPPQAPQLASN